MAPLSSLRDSLRLRLILGIGIMLIPMLVTGIVYYYSFLRLTLAFQEVVEEALEESAPLSQMELDIQEWRAALHQHHHRQSPGRKNNFLALTRHIEDAFINARSFPFSQEEEYVALEKARESWENARRTGLAHLESPSPPSVDFDAALETFDRQTDAAIGHLKTIHDLAQAEIVRMLKEMENIKEWASLSNILLFLISFGLVVAIGLILARSILAPLGTLEAGARQIARGDLKYRLEPRSEDELGKLMEAFNRMAEDLATSQTALKELSVRDPLTGLLNHREFFRLLGEEVKRAHRLNHPLSVLMCDLDFFKRVNDTYGHQTGDQVLLEASAILSKHLRQIDLIARYGGEEFAAILPEADGREAVVIAERLHQAIQDNPFKTATGDDIRLTISIGVAVFPRDGERADALVASADRALYRAKEEGRNRICRASS